jgi:protein O-GlcNAc transferase
MLHSNPLLFMAQARQRAGLLDDARALYAQALDPDPENVEALQRLALLEIEAGQPAVAIPLLERAVRQTPDDAEANYHYGFALQANQQIDEAIGYFERALEIDPNYLQASFLIGLLVQKKGNPERALEIFTELSARDPSNVSFRLAKGTCLTNMGLHGTASSEFYAVLELDDRCADAYYYLGAAQRLDRNFEGAAQSLERALELAPEHVDAMLRLADVFTNTDRKQEAVDLLLRALELAPGKVELLSLLGITYAGMLEMDKAIEIYDRALQIDPNNTAVLNNLGLALIMVGRPIDAAASFGRILEFDPVSSQSPGIASNKLFATHYFLDVTPEELLSQHLEYERHLLIPAAKKPYRHANNRDRDRPLRVGYVSYDFMQHPVGFFVSSVIVRHDPNQVISYCYNTRPYEDRITWRIKANAKHWRRMVDIGAEAFAERVREDEIDILIDLSGHTAGNRLDAFALKPAPIQATWAGYVGTTGLSAMDYLLADRFQVPPEYDRYHSETVYRMPNDYICYEPPEFAPSVGPLPALTNGYVIFGSFANPAKINEREIDVWARILHRVPGSALRLRYGNMTVQANVNRIHGQFKRLGIDPARIWLENGGSGKSMFDAYNNVDIGLDTFPYSGGLTTCEALWMGVPVITCPGKRYESRHSLTHLSNAGLTETIAADFDDYVEIAVTLAGDLPRLERLRQTMRARAASSPLCDSEAFTRDLEAGFRHMWHRWCDAQ